MKITISHKGDFSQTLQFLKKISKIDVIPILECYGEMGVQALAAATPIDTGKTAASWRYNIEFEGDTRAKVVWYNDNVNKGISIAVLLQYGHGTRTGGYVEGRDYINPAMQPVFDQMANDIWREVTSL